MLRSGYLCDSVYISIRRITYQDIHPALLQKDLHHPEIRHFSQYRGCICVAMDHYLFLCHRLSSLANLVQLVPEATCDFDR